MQKPSAIIKHSRYIKTQVHQKKDKPFETNIYKLTLYKFRDTGILCKSINPNSFKYVFANFSQCCVGIEKINQNWTDLSNQRVLSERGSRLSESRETIDWRGQEEVRGREGKKGDWEAFILLLFVLDPTSNIS